MKNTFKNYVESAGKSYKHILIILISICLSAVLIGIIITFLFKNFIFVLISLILAFGIYFGFFYYFYALNVQQKQNKENELFCVLGYFEIYIQNHMNVYQAINEIKQYCSTSLNKDLEDLLTQIDNDKTVKPFTDFASHFSNPLIQSLMIAIFQMIDSGENTKQINEFSLLFDNIKKERNVTLLMNKKRSFESMSTFPLLGAGLISLILTYSLLVIIGGFIS